MKRGKMKITVTQNRFHGGEYPEVYYTGTSEAEAIKAARKHACHVCQCGGPRIEREDEKRLYNWEAAQPFVERGPWWWD